MYFVDLSQRAQRFIDKLDSNLKERIESILKRLKDNPIPSDVKFIGREQGEKIFRYRIGNYRALYSLDETKKLVLIIKIDKRPRIYD